MPSPCGPTCHSLADNVGSGLLANPQRQVLDELDAVLALAKPEARNAEKFNFCVVA